MAGSITFNVQNSGESWNDVQRFYMSDPKGKSFGSLYRYGVNKPFEYTLLGEYTIDSIEIDKNAVLASDQVIEMKINNSTSGSTWYCYFDYQGNLLSNKSYNGNDNDNVFKIGYADLNYSYKVWFNTLGEYPEGGGGGGEDPPPSTQYTVTVYKNNKWADKYDIDQGVTITPWKVAYSYCSDTEYVFRVTVDGEDFDEDDTITIQSSIEIEFWTTNGYTLTILPWYYESSSKNIIYANAPIYTRTLVPGETIDLTSIYVFASPGATNTWKFYNTNKNRISDASAKKFSIEEDTTILLRFSVEFSTITIQLVQGNTVIENKENTTNWIGQTITVGPTSIEELQGYTFLQLFWDGDEVNLLDSVTITDEQHYLVCYVEPIAMTLKLYHKGYCRTIILYDENYNELKRSNRTSTTSTSGYLGISYSCYSTDKFYVSYIGHPTTSSYWYKFEGWLDENLDILSTEKLYNFTALPYRATIYCNVSRQSSPFKWDRDKVTGEEFYVSANEWNRLNSYIEAKINDGRTVLNRYQSGDDFTAEAFNESIGQISNIEINTVEPNDRIYASYFDEIKTKVNAMTAN